MSALSSTFGTFLFLLLWIVLLRDKWTALPLGRAVSSLIIACLFVASKLLSPKEAFDAINVETLALLFGCMVVSGVMEKHGAYTILETAISSGTPTPLFLLARISLVAGLSSAFITNDSSCIVLTPLILRLCETKKLNPMPYLLMLSTSANIGSAFSPIGNPQNMLIALLGNLFFVDFIKGITIATIMGLLINFAVIVFVYRSDILILSTSSPTQLVEEGEGGKEEADAGQITVSSESSSSSPSSSSSSAPPSSAPSSSSSSSSFSPPLPLPPTTSSSSSSSPLPLVTNSPPSSSTSVKRKVIFFILALLPILLITADSFIGLPWTVTLIGCLLLVTDGDEPDFVLERVDAHLLLFFSALFVSVAGFDATGVPSIVWQAAANAGVGLRSISGAFGFTLLVVIGSNTVSNVPLVLLMAPTVSTGLDVNLTWLMLAFVSTVAGNLTLMGSVANLIVAEKCKDTSYPLTFQEHIKVGVPSTLLTCLVGVPIVWICSRE